MNPDVSLRLTLLRESVSLSGQYLLIRLGLKKVTLDEHYALKQRTERVQKLIALSKGEKHG